MEVLQGLLPFPRRAAVRSEAVLSPDEVCICLGGLEDEVVSYGAQRLAGKLEEAGGGPVAVEDGAGGKAPFSISLEVGSEEVALRGRSPQAYAIRPAEDGMSLVATSSVGVAYAAATLAQAIRRDEETGGLVIPLLDVLDYPEIEERGFWYWPPMVDMEAYGQMLDWLFDRKLNYWDLMTVDNGLRYPSEKYPDLVSDDEFSRGNYLRDIVKMGRQRGINVVAGIVHFEQHRRIVERYPEMAAKKNESESFHRNAPAMCFSSEATVEFFANVLCELAELCDVDDVIAWLNEGDVSCCCESCSKQNEFAVQAGGIIAAWRRAQQNHPQLKLRLLLSQGSRCAGNEDVMAVVPREVKVSYYNGNELEHREDEPTSYSTKRIPIISPYIQRYVAEGYSMGLCAQYHTYVGLAELTRLRCVEAAEKGITWLNGFPSDIAHVLERKGGVRVMEKNSLAEYSWNPWGRDIEDAFVCWCEKEGYDDPQTAGKVFSVVDDALLSLGNLGSDLTFKPVVELALERPLLDQTTNIVLQKGLGEEETFRSIEDGCALAADAAREGAWAPLAALADIVRGAAMVMRLVYPLWRWRENEGHLLSVQGTSVSQNRQRLQSTQSRIRAVLEELESANVLLAEAAKVLGARHNIQALAPMWQRILPEYGLEPVVKVDSWERTVTPDEELR